MSERFNFDYLNSPTKRRVDVMGSIALASLVAPVGIVAGIATQVDNRSLDPFFRQTRVGQGLQPFDVIKFRTIPKALETEKIKPVGTYDPRASRLGRSMRELGIDEIPQLSNVLKGTMSLVGIRPLVSVDLERLEGISTPVFRRWHEIYQRTKPGLIGLSQIYRHSFQVSTDEIWLEAMNMDLEYAKHASLRNDLRILGATPWNMLVARYRIVDNVDAAPSP